MNVTLDSAAHTYTTDDGRTVPSVTQVLDAVGAYGSAARFAHQDAEARERGRLVHHVCAEFNRGVDIAVLRAVIEEPIPGAAYDEHPTIAGYLAAWISFCLDYKIKCRPDGIEAIVYHPQLNYAGQLDMATCEWRIAPDEPQARIVDIKTGHGCPADQLQTSAYESAWNSALDRPAQTAYEAAHPRALVHRELPEGYAMARAAVYLRPNGDYKCVEHTDIVGDANGWLAALAAQPLFNWLSNHKLLERRYDGG